jgi:hypothetical protein
MGTRAAALLVAVALAAGCQPPVPSSVATTTTSPTANEAAPGSELAPAATAGSAPSPTPLSSPSPTPTPSPASTATQAVVPPKPANTTWRLVSTQVSADNTTATEFFRATWSEPDGVATKFLLYGVTRCLRASAANDGTPCIVLHMPIPRDSLVLLGTAAGDARAMTIHWTRQNGAGPDPYWSYLIRATNAAGDSIFTILDTQNVCWQCVY